MFFVYLRNGQRLDIADAVTVIHRSDVIFLNSTGQVVKELPAREVLAYSRVLYDEANPPSRRMGAAVPPPSEAPLMPRRRHRTRQWVSR